MCPQTRTLLPLPERGGERVRSEREGERRGGGKEEWKGERKGGDGRRKKREGKGREEQKRKKGAEGAR